MYKLYLFNECKKVTKEFIHNCKEGDLYKWIIQNNFSNTMRISNR